MDDETRMVRRRSWPIYENGLNKTSRNISQGSWLPDREPNSGSQE